MRSRSAKQLAHLRLASQRIVGSDLTSPAEAVRWMVAMQAQDYRAARWAIGLRVPGATEASVEAALAEGSIVRSWPMRGTLHFTAAEDLPWMLALTAKRTIASAAARHRNLELNERTFRLAGEVAKKELSGGKRLARRELLAAFETSGIATNEQRGYHILWRLAQDGTICFGPVQGKEQLLVLLDEWVPHPLRLDREAALAELARRYYASHGPATVDDFAWWAKLTLTDARAGTAAAAGDVTNLVVDDITYYLAAEAEVLLGSHAVGHSTVLLPGFDEYLLGYRDRRAVLAPEHDAWVTPGNNGIFQPTLVVDGEVAGTWRGPSNARAGVDIFPFAPLSGRAMKEAHRAARAFGEYVGAALTSTVTP